jgi:hypothetical protein
VSSNCHHHILHAICVRYGAHDQRSMNGTSIEWRRGGDAVMTRVRNKLSAVAVPATGPRSEEDATTVDVPTSPVPSPRLPSSLPLPHWTRPEPFSSLQSLCSHTPLDLSLLPWLILPLLVPVLVVKICLDIISFLSSLFFSSSSLLLVLMPLISLTPVVHSRSGTRFIPSAIPPTVWMV